LTIQKFKKTTLNLNQPKIIMRHPILAIVAKHMAKPPVPEEEPPVQEEE
jgi:hypothetical protein